MQKKMKIGLIINPIAGMGGKVGLKGTDGEIALKKAISLGAIPEANGKVQKCLEYIAQEHHNIEICTFPRNLGEFAAKSVGLDTHVLDDDYEVTNKTIDTRVAVEAIVNHGVDLILFAGGDGTARDVLGCISESETCFGIPTGVKMHSAAFGNSPRDCAKLINGFIAGSIKETRLVEVMDLDEVAYKKGVINTSLFGFMKIPFEKPLVQGLKARSTGNEKHNQEAIAQEVIDTMLDEYYYLVGPGSTTKTILERLGCKSTLIGVDLIKGKRLVKSDLNESEILEKIAGKMVKLIVTPIGGQGYLLGRGNQQLSASVMSHIGKENIIVVATKGKIIDFRNETIKIDVGDDAMNRNLKGYYKTVTGYKEFQVLKVYND